MGTPSQIRYILQQKRLKMCIGSRVIHKLSENRPSQRRRATSPQTLDSLQLANFTPDHRIQRAWIICDRAVFQGEPLPHSLQCALPQLPASAFSSYAVKTGPVRRRLPGRKNARGGRAHFTPRFRGQQHDWHAPRAAVRLRDARSAFGDEFRTHGETGPPRVGPPRSRLFSDASWCCDGSGSSMFHAGGAVKATEIRHLGIAI